MLSTPAWPPLAICSWTSRRCTPTARAARLRWCSTAPAPGRRWAQGRGRAAGARSRRTSQPLSRSAAPLPAAPLQVGATKVGLPSQVQRNMREDPALGLHYLDPWLALAPDGTPHVAMRDSTRSNTSDFKGGPARRRARGLQALPGAHAHAAQGGTHSSAAAPRAAPPAASVVRLAADDSWEQVWPAAWAGAGGRGGEPAGAGPGTCCVLRGKCAHRPPRPPPSPCPVAGLHAPRRLLPPPGVFCRRRAYRLLRRRLAPAAGRERPHLGPPRGHGV